MLLAQHPDSTFDIIDLFHRGGFVMWPLLVCSILAVAGILDRIAFFLREDQRLIESADHEFRFHSGLPVLTSGIDLIPAARDGRRA